MAFNPFTNFRKNQKFWMPVILLLCMVTFVLCTGTRGDLIDLLLKGRQEGTPFAKVGGHNVYRKDFDDLKDQRNMVNEFMKRSLESAIKNLNVIMSSDKLTPEQRQKELPRVAQAKADMERRYLKPRYFGTGVKFDELVDFKVWLHEADRLGINLFPNDVRNLLNTELFAGMHPDNAMTREHIYAIIRELRSGGQRSPTEPMILKAIGDEYRARIAQMVLVDADPYLEIESIAGVRLPLSPAMLWDSFKAERSTFDVSLVPVEVDDFVKDVPEPSEGDLKSLFQSHYKDRYDPTSPTPGFEIPPSAKIELVIGDPTSPKFRQWSRAALLMETIPPIWAPSATLPMLGRYVGGPQAFRQRLEEVYQNVKAPNSRGDYLTSSWNEPDVYLSLAAKLASYHAEAAVAWIAGYSQPSNVATAQLGFDAFGPFYHPLELQKGLAEEVKARVPAYTTMVLSGTSGSFMETLGMFQGLDDKEKFYPLDIVKQPLTQYLEQAQAQAWVNENMNALRKKLDEFVGNRAKYERELNRNLDRLGLEKRVTKEFYNRFTIDKAPELQPLLQAYQQRFDDINRIEGRNLHPDTLLKENDFYKLFSDGTESFSVAGSTYKAKPWPPVATLPKNAFGDKEVAKGPQTVDLFEKAEKPILFWKIEDRVGKIPESIEPVKERVAKAWKFDKARETKALPMAKKIADEVQKSEVGPEPVLSLLDPALKKPLINLRGLAPLYTKDPHQPVFGGMQKAFYPGARSYAPYKIPKDTFVYPREDMEKDLLSLNNLKKPVETGMPKVDEYNKALFEAAANTRRVVQILTNKPRSVFYVACVTRNFGPSVEEFHSALKYAFPTEARGGYFKDYFFDQAYDQAGKQHLQALLDQLRKETSTEVVVSPEEKKTFDANEAL